MIYACYFDYLGSNNYSDYSLYDSSVNGVNFRSYAQNNQKSAIFGRVRSDSRLSSSYSYDII